MAWEYKATHHITHCGLCGSPRSEWLWLADRDRAGHQATSVICRNCGLVFLTPRMTAAGYAEFYGSGAYREIAKRFGHTTEKMETFQRKYAHAAGDWLAAKLEQRIEGWSLLDIGGSNGIVAAALKERFGLGPTFVLEPSQSECREAQTRGLFAELGSFETWEPPGPFDLITIWQSLDHLLDIAGSLAKVRRILKPDGLFALDIVNFAYLVSGFRSVEQSIKIDHPYGLTPLVVEAFLLRAGFEIVRKGAMLEGRKVFFLCKCGEPKDVLPDSVSINGLRNLIQKVRYARVGA